MTAFLEDQHHQGSGPVTKDSVSVQRSMKNYLEDRSNDITICLSTVALIVLGPGTLWAWKLLSRFYIPWQVTLIYGIVG